MFQIILPMKMQRKKIFLLAAIFSGVFLFSECMNFENDNDPRGKAFAGSNACIKCHQQIYNSYLNTAHYHAASAASSNTIEGSFSRDSNSFVVNDSLRVVMEKRDDAPYQVLYVHGKERRAERFDIVFGFAKGQTYLYWKNDLLFQLPVSYFTNLHSWTRQPGLSERHRYFRQAYLSKMF